MLIECVCCGWEGSDTELITESDADEASCPSCYGDDFIELDGNHAVVEPMYAFREQDLYTPVHMWITSVEGEVD